MIFSAIVGCFAFSEVKAKTVNGVRLTDLKSTYIEVSEYRPYLSKKTFIKLDYGQKSEELKNSYIKGDDGKEIEFNSGLDCVNKMQTYGYQLFQVYLKPSDTISSVKYYILKKR